MHNEQHSPFGAGWTLDGLQRLQLDSQGNAVLSDGNGGLQFAQRVACSTAGFVSWWPGDGTAEDIQDGNAGTLQNGATFAPGKVGQAFLLDGIDDFVDLGNAANLQVSGGDFTVAAWVQFNALPGDMSIVDKMAASGVNTDGWRLFKQRDHRFWFCLGGGSGNRCFDPSYTVFSTTVAVTGVWYHLAAVKSASSFSIYVNGILQDTRAPVPAFFDSHAASLRIGSYVLEGSYLNGKVDEVQLYNRALSASEIAAIIATGSLGQCTGPPAYVMPAGDFSTLVQHANGTFTRTLKDGTRIEFDARGLHTATVDPNGNTTLYRYDAQDRLIAVTDPGGQVTTLSYSTGLLDSITDPVGRSTAFAHEANGNLRQITDPDGSTRQFAYDERHRLTTQTSKNGAVTTYEYNFAGRHAKSNLPDGSTRQLAQSAFVYVGTNTRAGNYPGCSVEGISGQVERVFCPVVRPGGDIARFTDGNGNVTQFTTDRFGAATTITDPLGRQEGIVRDASGNPKEVILPSGHTFSQTYDTKGNLLTSFDHILHGTTTLTYEPTFNRITALTDPLTKTSTFTYDSKGNLTQYASPLNRTAVLSYDGRGLPTSVTDFLGTNTTFTYDGNGNLVQLTQGTGATQRVTTLAYTVEGYLRSPTDPEGRVYSVTYDALGRVTKQTLSDGRDIAVTYDASGNVLFITPPGRPVHGFTYTPVDLLDAYIPPAVGAGTTKTLYVYDKAQQLTRATRPDGRTVDLGYNNAGQLSTVIVGRGSIRSTYDPAQGMLTMLTSPDGEALSYTYAGELLTSTTWSGAVAGSVGRTYDPNGRLQTLTVNTSDTITFQYDADSLLTQAGALALHRDAQSGLLTGTTLGSVSDTINYNAFGERTHYSVAVSGTGLYEVQYTRDNLGRITTKTETVGGVTATFMYAYDLAGRLTEVQQNGTTTALYTYDSNGNLLRRIAGNTSNGSYDDQDRLLQYGATTYTYTANGELLTKTTSGQTTAYTYDEFGNLLSVTLPGGTVIEYLVDGQNRRSGKKVNGTLVQGFLYQDQLKPIAELDGSNTVVSRFVYGSKDNVPDYMRKGGVLYRIITDHLGSPRLVVNTADGSIVQQMTYDEFGNVLQDTNPGFQPFGFAGGLYDPDTGLVRFGVRDYDSVTGRWVTRDPIKFRSGQPNLYSYALNDPVNVSDPTGLSATLGDLLERFRWTPPFTLESLAAEAAQYWADRYVSSSGAEAAVYGVLGGLASLGDPEHVDATISVLSLGHSAGNACRPGRFYRYEGPGSNPEGRYLTSGRGGPPYGTNFPAAEDALRIPPDSRPINKVKEVEVPWYEPVAGPRPVTGHSDWGRGGGTEYYRGSLRFPK